MLTISVLEEENQNTSALNKTASTGITDSYNNSEQQKAQQEADEHIKNKIRGMLNKQEDQADISESPVSAISQRRQRKNFWRNVGMYFTTGGLFIAHIAGVWLARFISYKMISNKEIMSFRRR
jgi:hypothetical protein